MERAGEPTMFVADDADEAARDPLRRETAAYDRKNLPSAVKKQMAAPIRPQTDRAALLPEDAAVDYDLDDDADSFELDSNMTSPDARPPQHEKVGDDSSEETETFADKAGKGAKGKIAAPSEFDKLDDIDSDVLLSSLIDGEPEGTELQSVYEDLIERYRQAADARDRDRVARRLIDDTRADDVEVRALAVWAMVKLEDRGFERVLRKCALDGNSEIARLAKSGLARLG